MLRTFGEKSRLVGWVPFEAGGIAFSKSLSMLIGSSPKSSVRGSDQKVLVVSSVEVQYSNTARVKNV